MFFSAVLPFIFTVTDITKARNQLPSTVSRGIYTSRYVDTYGKVYTFRRLTVARGGWRRG